jgi:uncharacterized membrane protein YtjA (UPF0391 family)
MILLMVLFAILAIIFGAWGYGGAAETAWSGAVILFWVFVVLFILSLLGWSSGYGRRPLP